ncbi:hypothetical protein [uncultured Tateyamaria sp.]|uniref:hypothetical protein n=1 Tax=uncultured Tateyamaria sp. TaxID=455651 RepID=UPI00261797FC|nr:hypothetical protein [uncultured Tateyamaria sp.]
MDRFDGLKTYHGVTQAIVQLPDLGPINLADIVYWNNAGLFFLMTDLIFQEFLLRFEITQPVRDTLTTGTIDDVVHDAINLTSNFDEALFLTCQIRRGCLAKPFHFLLELAGECIQVV